MVTISHGRLNSSHDSEAKDAPVRTSEAFTSGIRLAPLEEEQGRARVPLWGSGGQ
jgi:hypothetical protein